MSDPDATEKKKPIPSDLTRFWPVGANEIRQKTVSCLSFFKPAHSLAKGLTGNCPCLDLSFLSPFVARDIFPYNLTTLPTLEFWMLTGFPD